MPLILGTNSIKDTGYNVANSVRFNDGDSPSLKDSASDAAPSGTRTKFTFSIWFKRGALGTTQTLGAASYSSSDEGYFQINSNDKFEWDSTESAHGNLITNRVLRDPSSWMHILVAVDTSQGTAANRMKIYINGTQETSFATETYPDQNSSLYWNVGGTYYPYIGRKHGGEYFDGYIAEVVNIDNQQLAPTSFGEFNSDSPTIWQPIDVSGLTFGTAGYYLDFEDSSELGKDVSGVGNSFVSANLAATDQSTDTCTNNFATLNPLAFEHAADNMSEGLLRFDGASSGAHNLGVGTIAVDQGKWWFEAEIDAYGGNNPSIGIASYDVNLTLGNYVGGITGTIGYTGNGNINENGSNLETGLNSYANGDIINIGLDLDNNKIYVYKNGSLENSGGTTITNRLYTFAVSQYQNSGHWLTNFGAGTIYSISSGNADGNGHGNFEYAPPSGYFALCTKNLAEFG